MLEKLQCNSTQHPLLLILGNRGGDLPREDKERIYNLLFKKFNVPVACIQPKWSLYPFSVFTDTFLVVNIQETSTMVLPIINKRPEYGFMKTSNLGGNHVTAHLTKLLTLEGLGPFESASEKQVVKLLKEKYAYVDLKETHPCMFLFHAQTLF